MKALSSLTFSGILALSMASTFSWVGWMRCASMLWPRYTTLLTINSHCDRLTLIPWFSSRFNTSSRVFRCSALFVELIKISSNKQPTPFNPLSTLSMTHLNKDGATHKPKGSRWNWYNPFCVLIVSNFLLDSISSNYKYALDKSILLNNLHFPVATNKLSVVGRGYVSD